ncbi:MAG: MATE family efflux transporter [Desulfovibrionaceae bacterium]|nr:MATE family efflux transporter [Desulfovibrionaceae bacterium]
MKVPYFQAAEIRPLCALAAPVFLAQLAQTSMAFVDTVMAGRAGAVDMAAVAVAGSFWVPAMLFGQGMLMSITPLVAQALGADSRGGVGRFLRQGAWLALLLALLLMGLIYGMSLAVLRMDGVEPDLARLTSAYLQAILWGLPGLMLYCVQRAWLEGHGRTQPAMLAGFIGFIVNIPLNYLFIFGRMGAPALGGAGCGVASAVVCWIMSLVMFVSVRRFQPRAWRFEALRPALVLRVARIGLPGAFALLVEVLSFAVIAVLIAPLGTTVVAGHQVAMSVAGLVFMLPLSLGVATTIRVGRALGEGNLNAARVARFTALCLALAVAVLCAAALLIGRSFIPLVYTDDTAVIALASTLLVYDAVYQISDATQVVGMATLRGYNDTRAIFGIALVSYWLISLPLGCALAFSGWILPWPLGVEGFWIALILGLSCAAFLVLWRLARLERLPREAVWARINR